MNRSDAMNPPFGRDVALGYAFVEQMMDRDIQSMRTLLKHLDPSYPPPLLLLG